MIENLEVLESAQVAARVHTLHGSGFRFVTMTACTNSDATVDLFYSFDRELALTTLKTTVPAGAKTESISGIYLAAAFAENEIAELFGVSFSDLVIDYGGRFILAEGAAQSPFGAGVIIERKDGAK